MVFVMNIKTLDAKNLLCPMPVIKVSKEVLNMQIGDQLTVLVTDPGAKEDIPCWCRLNGHKISHIKEENDVIRITIEIKNA